MTEYLGLPVGTMRESDDCETLEPGPGIYGDISRPSFSSEKSCVPNARAISSLLSGMILGIEERRF